MLRVQQLLIRSRNSPELEIKVRAKESLLLPLLAVRFLVWHIEMHPNRLPHFLVSDHVENNHVQVHAWWGHHLLPSA